MKKSLIALLVVLALVVTVSVFSVSAEDTTPVYASDLTVAADGATATGYCPHCDRNVTWTVWNGTSHQRSSTNGLSLHLFLANDVPNGGAFLLADKANGFIVLHLNGKTLTNTRGQDGPLQPFSSTAEVAVLTNTAGEGGIHCTGGAPINANCKGTLTIYGGTYSTTRTGTGVSGGIFNSDVISNGGSVAATQKTVIYGGTFVHPEAQAMNLGGAFYMTKGTMEIHGGTFSGKANEGGAFYLTGTGTKLTMSGTAVIENSKASIASGSQNGGAGVRVAGGAQFDMTGGTIQNCSTTANTAFGGGVNTSGGTFNFSGGTIKSCSSITGGGVFSSSATANFVMSGTAKIYKCTATTSGGALHVQYRSYQNELNGGTIEECSAPNGGAISFGGSAETGHIPTVTIDGTEIKNCSATTGSGGAAIVTGTTANMGAILNLNSGKIFECTAKSAGGGVYLNANGNFNMSGGSIEDCESVNGGASVRFNSGTAKMVMTGGTITGGETTGATITGGNIFSNVAATIQLTGGTISNGKAVAGGGNLSLGNFSSSSKFENMTFSGGTAPLGGNIDACKSITFSNCTITGGSAPDSFGGNIYIRNGQSVTLNNGTTVSNGTALRVPTANGGKNQNGQGGNVSIDKGTLTINNATISNTTGAANAQHAGNIYLKDANCTLNMTEGTISGGQALSYGGNIYAFTDSTVNVTGGTISAGKAAQGGNLYIRQTNKVTLKDCEITGGTGYSIHLNDAAAGATLNGATVSGATAGAIKNTGTLILTNATISGNTAPTAPGVYNLAGATVTMTGGSISGNTATTSSYSATAAGGNVYNAGTFNMISGTIENGIVQNSYKRATGEAAKPLALGGNIYNTGTFAMTSGTISGGQAKRSGNGDNNASGGNIYNTGTFTMTDGTITKGTAQTTGGNVFVGGTADAAATFTMEKGTISEGYSSNNQGGVRVDAYGTFTMNDGLLDDNNSYYAGGNIGASGTNAIIDINGGTISNGDSTNSAGGNIIIHNGATVTVDNATISGGTAKTTGGNVEYEGGSATFTGCTITEGDATTTGGNIHIALANGATFTKCEFTNCDITDGHAGTLGGNINITVAGSTFTGCEITGGVAGTKVVDEETGAIGTITTGGRGGNVACSVNATLTNCVIRNGEAWSNANPGGGNLYLLNGNDIVLDGCTVTGGMTNAIGGNICLHGSTTVVTIKGDSYIQGGISDTNWGGNIGYANAATLKLQGDTLVDGTDSRCHKNAQYGNNIGMNNIGAKLYMDGNATVKNGDNKYEGTTLDGNRYSVAVIAAGATAPKIYLAGNSSIDKIYLRGTSAAQLDGIVVAQAGFTGTAQVYTNFKTYNDTVVPGADVYGAVISDDYTGTGTLKVLNHGQTGYVVIVDNGTLKVCGITGFKVYNKGTDDEYTVENGFATLDAVVDAGMDYAKLYVGGTYTLSAKTNNFPIDLNNQVVTFNTGSYKLAPIDYRTDGHVVAKYTKLTVDNDENVVLLTQNPINNYQYLNVKGDDGKWTSNRVTVKLEKVSIKTAKDGVYYTTNIAANANAAPYLVDYGTAVSLVPDVVIDGNFLDHLDTNGVLYTAFDLNETEDFSIHPRSALVSGILSDEEDVATNTERAERKITATSFVTAIVDGEEVKIMADEQSVLSFKDIMGMLDNKIDELNRLQPEGYADTIDTAVAFYNKWADTFGTWDNLPNLKAEAAA